MLAVGETRHEACKQSLVDGQQVQTSKIRRKVEKRVSHVARAGSTSVPVM
jgi:hypothetical protein